MKKTILSIITYSLFIYGYAAPTSSATASKTSASTPNTKIMASSPSANTQTNNDNITINTSCPERSACYLISDTSARVLSAINKGASQSQTQSLIQDVIIPQFDFTLMTKYALGNNWKLATKAQQNQLVDLFKQLLISTYSSALSKFKDASITINKAHENDKKATVITEVKLANSEKNANQPILVEYNLAKSSGNTWKVYDVKLENVSLVTTYRNQFNEVVQSSKIDGLIKQLQTKINALKDNKG